MKLFPIFYLFLPIVMSTPLFPIDINCEKLEVCYTTKCDLPDYPDFHRFKNLMTPDSCPDVSCKEMAKCYMRNCDLRDYPDFQHEATMSCRFQCPRNYACQVGKCRRISRDFAGKSKKWPSCWIGCNPGEICVAGVYIDFDPD